MKLGENECNLLGNVLCCAFAAISSLSPLSQGIAVASIRIVQPTLLKRLKSTVHGTGSCSEAHAFCDVTLGGPLVMTQYPLRWMVTTPNCHLVNLYRTGFFYVARTTKEYAIGDNSFFSDCCRIQHYFSTTTTRGVGSGPKGVGTKNAG